MSLWNEPEVTQANNTHFLKNWLYLFRNSEHHQLSEQGKRALAAEFEKYIEKQMAKQNPLQKALDNQHVTQLLPALERV